jgi:hypothetical protein
VDDILLVTATLGGNYFCVINNDTGHITAYPSVRSLTRNDFYSTGFDIIYECNHRPSGSEVRMMELTTPALLEKCGDGKYKLKKQGKLKLC